MQAVITVGTAIAAAVVAATAGYFYRRREHLRERRLDSYQTVPAAFLDAARTAATMIGVHVQVGWPHELSRDKPEDERRALTTAHAEAWDRAAAARTAFEEAAYRAELVASS